MNLRKVGLVVTLFAGISTLSKGLDRRLNGIYITEDDFLNDVLSYASNSNVDSLIEASAGDIYLIRSGKKLAFRFGAVYGYRDRGHKFFAFGSRRMFRLYGYYEILDEGPLFIYNKRVPHVQYHYVQAAFFSLSLNSGKYRLTRKNLAKYAPLTSVAKKKIYAVKDHRLLAEIAHDKCLVNELILSSAQ